MILKGCSHNIWGDTSKVHPTVEVGAYVEIGDGVEIGAHTVIGAYSFLPPGVVIKEHCFIGPRVTFTNDKYPIAHNPGYVRLTTVVENGASIGAAAVILPGIKIGRNAQVGAGAVVTKDVPDGATVSGVPARTHISAKAGADITKWLLEEANREVDAVKAAWGFGEVAE